MELGQEKDVGSHPPPLLVKSSRSKVREIVFPVIIVHIQYAIFTRDNLFRQLILSYNPPLISQRDHFSALITSDCRVGMA